MADDFEELREDFQGKLARERRRRMEKLWAKMLPISREVHCHFLWPVVKGQEVEVEVVIGDTTHKHTVGRTVRLDSDGNMGLELDVKRLGYKGAVEKWALWKWHTARGTPVTERDVYELEPGFQPPTFVWAEEIPAEPEKRGPGRPRLAA